MINGSLNCKKANSAFGVRKLEFLLATLVEKDVVFSIKISGAAILLKP